jgi:hypothetical protein
MSPAILMRGITESVFTISWLNKDPYLATSVWWLDEIRSRLHQHREVARLERNARRRAQRRGDPVPPLTAGQSLGLLRRENVRRLQRLRKQTLEIVNAAPRRRERLKALKVDRVEHMPTFAKRASVAGVEMIYALSYRFDSNSAAHPNPLALEQFVSDAPEGGILINEAPSDLRPDPYVTGAWLLLALVDLAGERIDHTDLAPGLARITARLQALRTAGA